MKVLVADDHGFVRDAVKAFLEKLEPNAEVITAADFADVQAVLDSKRELDLIVLDLRMPGMAGASSVRAVKALYPETPIAIISGVAERSVVQGLMDAGAGGFIPKTLNGVALVNALRLVASGEPFIPVSMMSMVEGDGPTPASQAAGGGTPGSRFSPRELEVLQHLMHGRSNKEIAMALQVQEATVKLHLRGVYRKLGVRNRLQALRRAQEIGIYEGTS